MICKEEKKEGEAGRKNPIHWIIKRPKGENEILLLTNVKVETVSNFENHILKKGLGGDIADKFCMNKILSYNVE